VHQFIAALRQLQRPLVVLAAAILVVQTLVGGLASGHIAAQITALGADAAVICHGNGGDDGSAPAGKPTHDCCVFCTNPGPVALSASAPILDRLKPAHRTDAADAYADIRPSGRAIRAGPSQAPPIVA
jgi:hypothetical protein